MKINYISKALPNNYNANRISHVNFNGLKKSDVNTKELMTEETLKDLLLDDTYSGEYRNRLMKIKNSKTKISKEILCDTVESFVNSIKYDGSYPRRSPKKNLMLLLTYVKSVQPKDFNDVLEHLVDSIGRG